MRLSFRRELGDNLTEYIFLYEINCTDSEEISINYIYIKLPNKVEGNLGPNPTLDEVIRVQKGKYFIKTTPETIRFAKVDKIRITNHQFLQNISKGKIKKVKLVVNTNKYGNIASNSINL